MICPHDHQECDNRGRRYGGVPCPYYGPCLGFDPRLILPIPTISSSLCLPPEEVSEIIATVIFEGLNLNKISQDISSLYENL